MNTTLFNRLARSDDAALERLFVASPPPTYEALVGFWWRGFNTDPNLRILGLRKFIKAFFRGESGDEGCNVRVTQNRLSDPWQPRLRDGSLDAFAFYLVGSQTAATRLDRNRSALLLDYAASPRNPVWHIERLIRDYLVQPDPTDPDVVLGRAFLGVGGLRVPSSFFVLGRESELPAGFPAPR